MNLQEILGDIEKGFRANNMDTVRIAVQQFLDGLVILQDHEPEDEITLQHGKTSDQLLGALGDDPEGYGLTSESLVKSLHKIVADGQSKARQAAALSEFERIISVNFDLVHVQMRQIAFTDQALLQRSPEIVAHALKLMSQYGGDETEIITRSMQIARLDAVLKDHPLVAITALQLAVETGNDKSTIGLALDEALALAQKTADPEISAKAFGLAARSWRRPTAEAAFAGLERLALEAAEPSQHMEPHRWGNDKAKRVAQGCVAALKDLSRIKPEANEEFSTQQKAFVALGNIATHYVYDHELPDIALDISIHAMTEGKGRVESKMAVNALTLLALCPLSGFFRAKMVIRALEGPLRNDDKDAIRILTDIVHQFPKEVIEALCAACPEDITSSGVAQALENVAKWGRSDSHMAFKGLKLLASRGSKTAFEALLGLIRDKKMAAQRPEDVMDVLNNIASRYESAFKDRIAALRAACGPEQRIAILTKLTGMRKELNR